MVPKLYKAADVCELTQLQPYVLRSWEKEFPGIGVQKAGEATRLYRQADVDQVIRIKQLVFGEGLTLSGARRRLESQAPVAAPSEMVEAAEDVSVAVEAVGADARQKISAVRDGLRLLLEVLSQSPVAGSSAGDYQLRPPAMHAKTPSAAQRTMATRGKAPSAVQSPARRTIAGKKTKRASA